MLPSPISQLSQELIDRIIEAVVDTDRTSNRSSLLNCTLVCHTFRSRSQKILFSHVVVDVHRIDSFYRLLKDNLLIPVYVEDLELLLTNNDYKWVWEDQRFIRIMGLLAHPRSSLRKLRLLTKHGIQFIEDGQGMIQKFFKPYVAPKIRSLQISALSPIPIEVFISCIYLTDLSLSWTEVDITSCALPDVEILSRPICLHSLTYTRSPGTLSKLLGWTGSRPYLYISSLRTLTIGIEALDNLNFEQKIILACGGSLEELHITDLECHEINYTIDRFVDLQACPNLRILELDVNLGRGLLTKESEDDLATICRILSNIPDFNKLNDFRLIVHVGYWINQEPEGLLEPDWNSLRTQLSRILHSKKSKFSLHMDYLPIDYTLIEGCIDDDDSEASAVSYYVRCQNVLHKLVRDSFSAYDSEDALISSVSTSYTISSYYS